MVWIVGIIVAGFFLYKSRKFRWVIAALVVLTTIAATGGYLYYEQAEAVSYSKINPGDLTFDSINVTNEYSNGTLSAEVTNHSKFDVDTTEIEIEIFDCPDHNTKSRICRSVAKETSSDFTTIPAGGTRKMSFFFSTSNMPPAKYLYQPEFKVVKVKASK
jgi:hypothetical protein